MRVSERTVLGIAVFVLPAGAADAHLVNTGLGPLYDGISHLLLTPQDLLPLLAFALLAGLSGTQISRIVLFTLPLAWLLGGLAGLSFEHEIFLPRLSAFSLLLAGGLLATDRKLPPQLLGALGILFALLHGFLNGTAMSAAGLGTRAIVGIALTGFVMLSLLAAVGIACREGWRRIAVRVAGSWVLASGLFLFGWTFR